MTTSALDDVRGLGPARRKALLARFGSVARVRRATPEQVAEVPGIGPALAERVLAALSAPPVPGVNLTTGEIMGDDGGVHQSGGTA
jgi:excinuclease ABC subunit C